MARFEDLSPRGKRLATLAGAVSVVVIAAAERDLQHRSEEELNGSKLMWRLLCLNALGALSYFKWGRRRGPRSDSYGGPG